MGKLFGTDGIRGEANRYPMSAEIAFGVGQAMAHLFKKEGHRAVIIIGKDTRISGYMLESSLEAGITSMGGYSYLAGVMPTPGIAFATQSMRADAGVVISASHNPFQDNGLKIFGGDGYKLSDNQENVIEDLILNNKLADLLPKGQDIGKAFRLEGVNGRYIVFAKNTFPRNLTMEGMKIVLDTANGATYRVAPDTFMELGADVEVIHKTPNGTNINDQCGSQHTERLRKTVVETGAAIGLAFDGDADRIFLVDETGELVKADATLLLLAKYFLQKNPGLYWQSGIAPLKLFRQN
jgi:phosphoglucosamine mutase